MVSRERFTGAEKPWTDAVAEELRQVLEPQLSRQSEVPQTTKPGIKYPQLVSTLAELADWVWHRGGEKNHGLVLVLTNPSIETLGRIHNTEVALKGELPLIGLDFQIKLSPLSRKERKDMESNGYKWVPRVEKDATP